MVGAKDSGVVTLPYSEQLKRSLALAAELAALRQGEYVSLSDVLLAAVLESYTPNRELMTQVVAKLAKALK